MSEEEAKVVLERADALLDLYIQAATPVLEYLKARFCEEFNVEPDGFEVEFGCWEAGIETICLHARHGLIGPRPSDPEYDAWNEKEHAFEDKWSGKHVRVKVMV